MNNSLRFGTQTLISECETRALPPTELRSRFRVSRLLLRAISIRPHFLTCLRLETPLRPPPFVHCQMLLASCWLNTSSNFFLFPFVATRARAIPFVVGSFHCEATCSVQQLCSLKTTDFGDQLVYVSRPWLFMLCLLFI